MFTWCTSYKRAIEIPSGSEAIVIRLLQSIRNGCILLREYMAFRPLNGQHPDLEDGTMLPLNDTISPKKIATWIVNHIDRGAGEAVTHLKLQKLVYYVEAWYLANFDKELFDEAPQAWTHGPVYRSLYDKYKGNSWDALPPEKAVKLPDDLGEFVNACIDEYGQFGAKRLERLTHSEDPWKITRKGLPLEARCENEIDKLLIRNYYASKIGKKEKQKI